jgi:BlaI family transcriptional regulator, penicillinase repressor
MRRKAAPRDIPPPLELECLRVLWQIGEGTVHDVREVLAERRDLAYTTVMTLLDRLARKGTVSRVKSGRSFLYAPAVERDVLRQAAVRELVDLYFDGDEPALRAWLFGTTPAALAPAAAPERNLDTALL